MAEAPGITKFWKAAFVTTILLGVGSYFLWGRPLSEKEVYERNWVLCENEIKLQWAAQDPHYLRERVQLIDRYTFGFWEEIKELKDSDASKLKDVFDYDDRTESAKKIGVSEAELIALDQKIEKKCGPFDRERVR